MIVGSQVGKIDVDPASDRHFTMKQFGQKGIEFDWVFSGINKGANLGSAIYVAVCLLELAT